MPYNREQEQVALDALHQKQQKIKNDCFDSMQSLTRYPLDQLHHTGHKTIEAGVLWTLHNAMKEINKLVEAHIKRYPD